MAKQNYGRFDDLNELQTISFGAFYAVHAAQEAFNHVPDFHHDLIDFLSHDEDWSNHTAVIQCFRNASKSSLVATWVAWRLVRNPKLLFLIQSADDNTAAKMIGDIQKIITFHPLAKHLREKEATWGAKGFRVKGASSGRNLSVSARGIFSNVTGARADIIVFDDVEVPRNSGSEELRSRIRDRIAESAHLLNPNGLRLFIGTPHNTESIYPEIIDKGAAAFRVPLLEDLQGTFPNYTGTSNWPERWTTEMINRKQRECRGRDEFLSQYQLIASSPDGSYLEPELLKVYDCEPVFSNQHGRAVMTIEGKYVTSMNAFWDPSMSKAGGDDSVLSIQMCTRDGDIYIHRVVGLKKDGIGDLASGADGQALQVRALLTEFRVPLCFIETNGIGNFLPQILLKHTRGLGIAIDGKHTMIRKSDSIQTAYETPMSAGIMHVHKSVMATKFQTQLRDFNPKNMKGRDDFIDAPAKGIAQLPVAIGRGVTNDLRGFSPYRQHGGDYDIGRDYA